MIQFAKDLSLPPEISGRRTAVFGISGSGKSNTATVIVEGLLQTGEQVVIIDPKGEAWGLLSLANGKPSNLDIVIFGEPNGHIEALDESHGPRLADFVFETGQSVALSLLGFNSDASERRFVASFLRHLYRRKTKQPKKSRTLVVFEEAHLFVPEGSGKGFSGEVADLAGSVQRIARQGRSFGLGSLFVDQRPQDVSKRVISQVDTIICHQLTHKTDRAALSDWVKGYDTDGRGDTFLNSLASLEAGHCWVWSPSWMKIFQRVKAIRRRTYDSGAAPDEAGSAGNVQRAAIDLDKLRGQLAEVVAKAKADDPKELRRQIAELTKQLKQAQHSTPVIDDGAIQLALQEQRRDLEISTNFAMQNLYSKVGEALSILNSIPPWQPLDAAIPTRHPRRNGNIVVQQIASKQVGGTMAVTSYVPTKSNGAQSKGEMALLIAIAQSGQASREQLGIMTGYKRSSRDAYLQRLRTRGLIQDVGGDIALTQEGEAALPKNFEPLPTGRALLEHWLSILPEGEKIVLQVVASQYPHDVDRERISDVTNYKRSSRDAYLQRLKTRRLISDSGKGKVIASDLLFDLIKANTR